MEPRAIIQKLDSNLGVFQHLLQHCSEEQYAFRPKAESWCLLEVICHLRDEEVEDFRARVKHILTTPNLPLPAISPHLWPTERQYLQEDFKTIFESFIREREHSVAWLRSLNDPDWEQSVDHPKVGPRSAKKFLVNWLAHDYHHFRQINRINHGYLKFKSGDDLTYAGNW